MALHLSRVCLTAARPIQVTFVAQGGSAYGDIVVIVNGSGDETHVSSALLRAPNGYEVVLKDEKPGGGMGGTKSFKHTVDV